MITRTHAHTLRKLIEKAAAILSDTEALEGVELFAKWDGNAINYDVGNRVRYGDKLFKCLTAHTSQATWQPDVSPSLWARVDDPAQEWPEWIQPTGATDAYNKGDKVSHNGRHWISEHDANTWEPGVYGWYEA